MSEEIRIKKISTGQQSYEIDAKYWGGCESTIPPNNQIWYTSTDGEIVEPYSGGHNNNVDALTTFGANIVSNTYIDGKGVIEFDGDVSSIGNSAFYDCNSLTNITIPDSVNDIGNSAFEQCESLTNITIPDSVTTIGNAVFATCTSMTSVTIPDSVTDIGNAAFINCDSLTSITIPDSITDIGGTAFASCDSLTSVYCKPTTPPTGGSSMFSSNVTGRKIYVPIESVNTYKITSGWNNYADDIVGCIFEDEAIAVLTDDDISSIVNTYFTLSAIGSGSGGSGEGISQALDDESSDIYEETPIE